jgi:hypothetical protein
VDLSNELRRARREGPELIIEPELTRDNWMVLADIRPGSDSFDDFDDISEDKKY